MSTNLMSTCAQLHPAARTKSKRTGRTNRITYTWPALTTHCALAPPRPNSRPTGNRLHCQLTAPKTAGEVQEIFKVPCQPLAVEKKLSAGAFGTVFRGRTPCGHLVAIKQVVQDSNFVNREADICKMLAAGNHPNIVEVKGIYFEADVRGRTLNLVLEYVPKTMRNVLLFLSGRDMWMKASHVQIYMYQLARALLLLYQQNSVHRDIKPEN